MPTRTDLDKLLSTLPADLSNLSEQELNYKIDQLKGHSSTSGGPAFIDKLTQRLKDYGVAEADASHMASSIGDFVHQTGKFPSFQEAEQLLPRAWRDENAGTAPLLNALKDQSLRNEFSSGLANGEFTDPRVNENISNLQGLSQQKASKRQQEEKLQAYLGGLPAENEKAIGDYESSLQASNSDFFGSKLASQIIASMNARGITSSGDLTDSLATGAAGLARNVQDTIAPIRYNLASDVSNKKYENVLRGALEQGQSLDSAVAFSRNMLASDRQNQFTAGQSALNRSADQERFNQTAALQNAMTGSQKQPGALDYFLDYGLPILGGAAGGFAGAAGAGIAKNLFKSRQSPTQ